MKRCKLAALASLAASMVIFRAPAVAQDLSATPNLTVHPIRGGAYWIEGGSSNEGFVVGTTGVVVFDAQISPAAATKALAEIARVTPKPVDTLVLSHADPDHLGGVPAFPRGTTILAHENSRAQILASAADAAHGGPFGNTYRVIAAHYLPTRTLSSSEDLTLDGVHARLIYAGPVHSSGDLMLYLPAQKIVFGGDVLLTSTGRFPVIHIGGSSLGWITAVKMLLALDADVYVPGHGAIESKAKLTARLHDVEQRREDVKRMVYAGKSLAEIERTLPDAGANPMFPTFTQTLYKEFTQGYPPQQGPWANIASH